jgi:hypothetical protein
MPCTEEGAASSRIDVTLFYSSASRSVYYCSRGERREVGECKLPLTEFETVWVGRETDTLKAATVVTDEAQCMTIGP